MAGGINFNMRMSSICQLVCPANHTRHADRGTWTQSIGSLRN